MDTKKILNIGAFGLVAIGLLFKSLHWPGSNIIIVISGITMLLTLFMFAVKDNKKAGLSDGLNYFLVGTIALYIIGAIVKFQHWSAGNEIMAVPYVLSFVFLLIVILQKNDFKISGQFLITFFTYFLLLLGTIHNNRISQFLGSGGVTISEQAAPMDNDSTKTVTNTDK